MRFACGDMRDHIISYQNDHRPSYWRQRALRQQERLRIDFREIFRRRSIFDFCNNICQERKSPNLFNHAVYTPQETAGKSSAQVPSPFSC